jgi:hypothetical protein
MLNGLSKNTSEIIEKVSKIELLKEFTLVGGTALSFQIQHRLSEDLDFMKWKNTTSDSTEVGWNQLEAELKKIGNVKTDLLGFDQVNFLINDVKITFYGRDSETPVKNIVPIKENIFAADLLSIGIMKLELIQRRSKFRDYYDIYCLLQEDISIKAMIDGARTYSGNNLREKNLLAFISNSQNYKEDTGFKQLEPKYNVSGPDIENFIIEAIKKEYSRG